MIDAMMNNKDEQSEAVLEKLRSLLAGEPQENRRTEATIRGLVQTIDEYERRLRKSYRRSEHDAKEECERILSETVKSLAPHQITVLLAPAFVVGDTAVTNH